MADVVTPCGLRNIDPTWHVHPMQELQLWSCYWRWRSCPEWKWTAASRCSTDPNTGSLDVLSKSPIILVLNELTTNLSAKCISIVAELYLKKVCFGKSLRQQSYIVRLGGKQKPIWLIAKSMIGWNSVTEIHNPYRLKVLRGRYSLRNSFLKMLLSLPLNVNVFEEDRIAYLLPDMIHC